MGKVKPVTGLPAATTYGLPTSWESKSNRLPTIRQVGRVHSAYQLRQMLHVSASVMADALYQFGLQVTRQTVYTWERAARDEHLPRGYWKRRYMSDKAIAAYHTLIQRLVAWLSSGRYQARVCGKRIWRVKVWRVA